MKSQDNIFLKEGDNYYKRNKHASFTEKNDSILGYLSNKPFIFKNVLEIGCSDGARLSKIAKIHSSVCHGIEPSKEAVDSGTKQFSNITLKRGASHDLSLYEDSSFDLVILNFVFHWIDRKKLFLSISDPVSLELTCNVNVPTSVLMASF